MIIFESSCSNDRKELIMKMRTEKRALDKIFKRRDRIEMPEYQREEVWPIEKKRLLIDTILRNWSLPKFYFDKVGDGSFECVDGQQRLKTIIDFFEGNLILDRETAERVGGYTYDELPPKMSDAFDDFEIDIEEIEESNGEELEELFKRLQLGTPLITAERLNAISGQMRTFCRGIVASPFFSTKIKLKNTRFSHYEIAVRWMFIESRGIEPRVRLPELEDFLKSNKTFSTKSSTAKIVNETLKYLDKAFSGSTASLKNKANTLSVCMLAARVKRELKDDKTAEKFGRFVEDFFTQLSAEVEKGTNSKDREMMEYQRAITSASAEAPSIKTRLRILTKRLAIFDSSFAFLIGSYPDADQTLHKGLAETSETIQELIQKINDKYSADHGKDLFKMTNRTTAALLKLKRPRKEQPQFEDLIDDLYFLLYEGSGSGKRLGNSPSEFVVTDIKFLRANTRHDLDHGKPSEVAKNRKKKAAVFKKYSGKASIGECGEEELLTAQSKVLESTEEFLNELLTQK